MQRAFLVHGLLQAFEDVGHFALVPLEIFRLWRLRSGPDAPLKAENAAENASAAEPENTQRAADLSALDDCDGVLCTSEDLT